MFAFTVRQVEVFLAICETGSFRRAAERIGISEAGVSNHMRALERQLGCLLFARRRGAKASLLDSSFAFREEAAAFVARGRALYGVAKANASRRSPLNTFVGTHLLEDFVRPALPEFARQHPHISLNFVAHVARTEVRKLVLERKLQVVLLSVQAGEQLPGSQFLAPIEAGIYGRKEHATAALEKGLASVPFVLGPLGSFEERGQLRYLAEAGVPQPSIALNAAFHEGAIASAVKGAGVTISLKSIVQAHDTDRDLELIVKLPPWELRLYTQDDIQNEVREALIEFFLSILPLDKPSKQTS